jgi:hypothetical protein
VDGLDNVVCMCSFLSASYDATPIEGGVVHALEERVSDFLSEFVGWARKRMHLEAVRLWYGPLVVSERALLGSKTQMRRRCLRFRGVHHPVGRARGCLPHVYLECLMR